MRLTPWLLAVSCSLLLLGGTTPALWAAESGDGVRVRESRGTFTSGTKAVTVDRFEPEAQGKYPAVILVHGADGFAEHTATLMEFARMLARTGHVALVVHYFERTDTRVAKGKAYIDAETIEANFVTWMATLADAVTFATKQPNVDPRRVGLLGFSLGAYLSLSVATLDSRVGAVVDFYGGLPAYFCNLFKKFPPVLILHGKEDKIISVDEATKLERLFKERKLTYEMKLYPRQGHVFKGDDARDAAHTAIRFLKKYLHDQRR